MKDGRSYVGASTDLRSKICSIMHESSEGGNSGISAKVKRIERTFYWPSLRTDISKFIQECTTCQRNKVDHIDPLGLLQPIAMPKGA